MGLPDAYKDAAINNEIQLIRFAEDTIMIELARAKSHTTRMEWEKCFKACPDFKRCPETGALELGIGLIGVSKSSAASDALTRLLGLKLDGAGSEALHCQMILRGKKSINPLVNINATQIAKHCQSTFQELQKRPLKDMPDLTIEQMCHSEDEIKLWRDNILKAIKSGLTCDDDI